MWIFQYSFLNYKLIKENHAEKIEKLSYRGTSLLFIIENKKKNIEGKMEKKNG